MAAVAEAVRPVGVPSGPPAPVDETEEGAAAARRRRMEIRRKKLLSSSGPVTKRKRLVFGVVSQEEIDQSSLPPHLSYLSSSHSRPATTLSGHPWADRPRFRRGTLLQGEKGTSAGDPGHQGNPGTPTDSSEETEGAQVSAGAYDSDDSTSSGTSDGSGVGADGASIEEVEAAIQVADSLLREEKPKQPASTDPAAAPLLGPAPRRPPPPSKCCSTTVHSSAANAVLPSDACPTDGVLSVCGRRREMEDAVALVPAFTTVPCGSLFGCQGKHLTAGEVEMEEEKGVEEEEEHQCQLHMFSVFDGHGGSQAALFCAQHVPSALAFDVAAALQSHPAGAPQDEPPAPAPALDESSTNPVPNPAPTPSAAFQSAWKEALTSTFLRVDAEISGHCAPGRSACDMSGSCPHEPIAAETVGTTAILTVLTSKYIVTANAGDSRAVLSRGGKSVALSIDHKPEREDEMKRVEKAGGRVIFWNGYRVLGVLAMSRALGDRYLKPYVIAEPELTFTPRSDDDECIILASDGLWDVVSSEVACDVARRCLNSRKEAEEERQKVSAGETVMGGAGQEVDQQQQEEEESPAMMAAAVLTKLALARGSGDNISVVVVDLRAKAKQ